MDGEFNITLLGDSISRGVVYDEEKDKYVIIKDSFCNIVQQKLKGAINNAGKFGSTVIKGSKKLYEDMSKKTPDIVIIEFGGNDCDFNWDEVASNPLVEHQPNTDLPVFQETLRKIIMNLNELKVTPVLMTLPPLEPNNYFNWISKKSDEYGKNILKFLGSVNRIYSWHESYNMAIVNLANETHTSLIDIRSIFIRDKKYESYLCIDGIHPNAKGHKLIADKIIEYVKTNYSYLLKDTNQ